MMEDEKYEPLAPSRFIAFYNKDMICKTCTDQNIGPFCVCNEMETKPTLIPLVEYKKTKEKPNAL